MSHAVEFSFELADVFLASRQLPISAFNVKAIVFILAQHVTENYDRENFQIVEPLTMKSWKHKISRGDWCYPPNITDVMRVLSTICKRDEYRYCTSIKITEQKCGDAFYVTATGLKGRKEACYAK